MANYYPSQFLYSGVRNLTGIFGTISVASGTVGVSSASLSSGATAARTAVGEVTITLPVAYQSLVSADFNILCASPLNLNTQIKSQSVNSAKTVVFRFMDPVGGTAADPGSACTVYAALLIRNSSVNP